MLVDASADLTPPAPSFILPTDEIVGPFTVTLQCGELVTSFGMDAFSVTNGRIDALREVSSPGELTLDVTPDADGQVIVGIAAGATTDLSGNNSTAGSVTAQFTDPHAETDADTQTETETDSETDSDADGVSDAEEGSDDADGDSDGMIDRDSDNDGLSDLFETLGYRGDDDGHVDALDGDSDNDGTSDTTEAEFTDVDYDGIVDLLADTNADRIPGSADVNVTGGSDADGDGIPDMLD